MSAPSHRRPVHVVYGGAHLFKAEVCSKFGAIALRTLADYAPDAPTLAAATGMEPAIAERVYPALLAKLRREPVEDYRIDFEDGYGFRSDTEEDGHAESAAGQAALAARENLLPPFCGIRIKPLDAPARKRSLRTLNRFLLHFREASAKAYPPSFVVTLPKITEPSEVRTLVEALGAIENLRPGGQTLLELMIETPQALRRVPELIAAADGRCVAVHFGPYDYAASLGIAGVHQSLTHPACDFARNALQVALAGYNLGLGDGPTTQLPIAPHRGELTESQRAENREVVHRTWKLHYDNVRRALGNGIYQGWDLHPAQLPTRFAAVFAFFEEGKPEASARMRNFMASAAQATRIGAIFDDAATAQGLLNFFLRALHCGAIQASDLPALAGLTAEQLQTGSFAQMLETRKA